MTCTQILGLKNGQRITEIKDANGELIDDAKIRTIAELGANIPFRFGDPTQRIIEIITDRPARFTIVDEKGEFVCCICTNMTE